MHHASRAFTAGARATIDDMLPHAHRWQHIVSGAHEPQFAEALKAPISTEQLQRIGLALAPILPRVSP
jgi:hypothetical protein